VLVVTPEQIAQQIAIGDLIEMVVEVVLAIWFLILLHRLCALLPSARQANPPAAAPSKEPRDSV